MRFIKIITFFVCTTFILGCEQDIDTYDFTKYKFVSFIDQGVTLAENYATTDGKEVGYPIYLKYDGSTLDEDITVNLKITEIVAKKDIDYSIESESVLFKAGSILSEPFYLKPIDNLTTNLEERSLIVEIESVSNPKISIGVGLVNQSNKAIDIEIQDNECSDELDIFNSTSLALTSNKGSAMVTGIFDSGTSTLRLEGDLVAYGPLANTSLEVDLTPVEAGAKIGTLSFDDYYAGKDTDGWEYTYKMESEGEYDVCSGSILDIAFGVYYLSGGSWVYWYSVDADISL